MVLPQIRSQSELQSAISGHSSTIIIFSAVWSQISEATKDNFERIGAQYPTLYQAWVSTDDNPELAEENGVNAIPATIGYKDGAEVTRFIGPQLLDSQIEAFISRVL
ncbi:hypothetical protein BDV25DRAFT_147726 [Aspergillus avenaceus]|uniref:Thioredoxin domain-containing protein n=1 Tax=Aspergillus avenaceus TaxID=36643 RepID=A0A5N6U774_ASPAV|nr:hypothetical protein BDV25DRAFT_147726 [Aspergillus avenaceus]